MVTAVVRSKVVVLWLSNHCFIVVHIVLCEFCVWYLVCWGVPSVFSNLVIISLERRELVALFLLTFDVVWLLVICVSPWICRGLVCRMLLLLFLVILTDVLVVGWAVQPFPWGKLVRFIHYLRKNRLGTSQPHHLQGTLYNCIEGFTWVLLS